MLNKNKALTNYICGILTSLLVVSLMLILDTTDNGGFISSTSGTSIIELAGWGFLFSFISLFIVYTITIIIFADKSILSKIWLPILISSLAMAAISSMSVAIIDWQVEWASSSSVVLIILFTLLLCLACAALIVFAQEQVTKFLLSSTAMNRADEWEYTNFVNLMINKVSITHKENYSILKSKGKKFIVKFMSDEGIQRKLFLDGDTKDKDVSDFEAVIAENGGKGYMVFLSNELPAIVGVSSSIKVLTSNDLFKVIKGRKDD